MRVENIEQAKERGKYDLEKLDTEVTKHRQDMESLKLLHEHISMMRQELDSRQIEEAEESSHLTQEVFETERQRLVDRREGLLQENDRLMTTCSEGLEKSEKVLKSSPWIEQLKREGKLWANQAWFGITGATIFIGI